LIVFELFFLGGVGGGVKILGQEIIFTNQVDD
jgi:hypothetical protein